MEVPTSAPRAAAGKRAQRKRAEGRVAMRLTASGMHSGGQLTMLGAALSQALKELEAPAPVSRSDAAERAPASRTDAAELREGDRFGCAAGVEWWRGRLRRGLVHRRGWGGVTF